MVNRDSYKKIMVISITIILGLILLLLFIFKFLSPVIWGFLGTLFVLSCIVTISINNNNFISLITIFAFQIILKVPLFFKNHYYIFQPDEAYHLGYSLILSSYNHLLPIERMIGYEPFPLLDLIVSKSILKFGLSNTLISVKIINSILLGLLTIYLADKTFQMVFREKKRIATFIFAACYKFLFFSSLYVYETLTFLLFVLATYIIVSMYWSSGPKKHSKKIETLKFLILVSVFTLLGFWHYFSYFLSFFLIVLFFISQNEVIKYNFRNRSSKDKILRRITISVASVVLVISLNIWIMISARARGQVGNYFYSSLSGIRFFEVIGNLLDPYSRFFVIFVEICLLLLLYAGVFLIRKLIYSIFKNRTNMSLVLNVKAYLTSVIVVVVVSSLIYFGYSKNLVGGLNTTQNLGILSFFALFGMLFFIFNLLIYPLITKRRNPLLISIYSMFTILTCIFVYLILNDIFGRISSNQGGDTFSTSIQIINELSYRLIPYIFFFGCMFFAFYEKYILQTVSLSKNIVNKPIINTDKRLKLKKIIKKAVLVLRKFSTKRNLSIFFVFLLSIQSIAFAPWQIYHSELNIPEDDLYLASQWMRYNLNQETDLVFVEYMYRSIAAYSFLNIPQLENKAADVILGLYYQRDIKSVINTLRDFNCAYFIFDLVGLHEDYMTKVARDKYLISFYNIDPIILEFYNDTIPVDSELTTIYSTDTLLVLEII